MPFYVYIIRCKRNKLYTGYSKDVARRYAEHLEGRGAKFTQWNHPKKILFVEIHPDRATAMRRERQVKKMSKKEKERLVRDSHKAVKALASLLAPMVSKKEKRETRPGWKGGLSIIIPEIYPDLQFCLTGTSPEPPDKLSAVESRRDCKEKE